MKRLSFLFSTICLLTLLFYSSCEKKTKTTENNITFDSIRVNETYYLFNDTNKPSCNLQINFIYPKSFENNPLLPPIQALFIEKTLGETFTGLSPDKAIQNYKEQYINEFKRFESDTKSDELFDSEESEDETGHSYYARIKNLILYNRNNLISFKVEYHNYEGGAHGSSSVYGYVLDLKTGKLIREDQFSGNNYKENLSALITKKIAEANGVENPKELENIGYNSIEDIVPNGNFTLDDKGITYYYNENEIAAYVMGLTEVFIPYEEISIYMKKDNPIASLAGL